MTKYSFEQLDITQQQELTEQYGEFLRTQTVENYIYDTYLYDTFYVVYYCSIDNPGEPRCKCFATTDFVENFIRSVDYPMS